MTLYQFNLLDDIEQIEILWKNAVEVSRLTKGKREAKLFYLDNFYVELSYKTGHLMEITTSAGDAILNKYLKQIDLKELEINPDLS